MPIIKKNTNFSLIMESPDLTENPAPKRIKLQNGDPDSEEAIQLVSIDYANQKKNTNCSLIMESPDLTENPAPKRIKLQNVDPDSEEAIQLVSIDYANQKKKYKL